MNTLLKVAKKRHNSTTYRKYLKKKFGHTNLDVDGHVNHLEQNYGKDLKNLDFKGNEHYLKSGF